MKVSLLLVVKDKKDVLRNTLHSIIKQKTSFPYEGSALPLIPCAQAGQYVCLKNPYIGPAQDGSKHP